MPQPMSAPRVNASASIAPPCFDRDPPRFADAHRGLKRRRRLPKEPSTHLLQLHT